MIRVTHLGDVAGVAQALAVALNGFADVELVELRQAGARWPITIKPLVVPIRLAEALRVAFTVGRRNPDVAHVHWIPNGVVGPLLRRPWVLHAHGDDIRGVSGWRLGAYVALLRRASAVVYSTPDLGDVVRQWRPDATWLPAPIPALSLDEPRRYDVLVNASAHWAKGSATAFEALRLVHFAAPRLRLAAIDGPAFEEGPWDRIPLQSKNGFHRLLASSDVIIGQFAAGALGIADLEAMALGRPLVTWIGCTYPQAPPVANARLPEEVASAVLSKPSGEDGPAWVQRFQGPEVVARRALGVYQAVM